MTIEAGRVLSENERAATQAGPSPLDREQLCQQYEWLRSVSRALVRDPWRAEDVAQETLLAALAAPPRDSSDAKHMRAWLGRVAFNLSRLGARKAARQLAREARVARQESLPGVSEELELSGTARVLEQAIAALPASYCELVRLRYFDGLTTAEIAARQGTSELAVRKRLWRARLRLKAMLERGPERESFWASLLLLRWNPLRAPGLGVAAGVVATVGGLVWWLAGGSPARSEGVELAWRPAASSLERIEPPASAAWEPVLDGRGSSPGEPRRSAPPERPPRTVLHEQPSAVRGSVLDLAGRPQRGLEVWPADAVDEPLALSDAQGRFQVDLAPPLLLSARAPGWATLVAANVRAGFEDRPAHIVVTPAVDLALLIVDEDQQALADIQVELRCRPTAFSALDFPVRLPSPLLRSGASDSEGRLAWSALARGRGLYLWISRRGFEPLEVETEDLGEEARVTLRSEARSGLLAGTVLHRNGLPASGAVVRLGSSSVVADERGRYRLPLWGVRPESRLEASDPAEESAPVAFRHFGARLAEHGTSPDSGGVSGYDFFLGPPLVHVEGRLAGRSPQGWLVAAYSVDELCIEEDGSEVPSARAISDEGGGFALALPAGRYDLYALSPAGAFALVRPTLVTGTSWGLEIPDDLPLESAETRLVSDDGRLLAQAEVALHARLDGSDGRRKLLWRTLASDARGRLVFLRDPALALELVVEHGEAGGGFLWSHPGALTEAVLPRPALLRLRGVPADVQSAALLDEAGDPLSTQDPFGPVDEFGFHAGESPTVEVPPTARWIELRGGAAAGVRLPFAPVPGEQLVVQP